MKLNKINYEIIPTKEDFPTILVESEGKKIPLHSKLYPSKESSKFNLDIDPEKYDILIILGIGLGYHLVNLKNNIDKYKKIFLIERIDTIEKELKKNPNTSFLVDHEKTIIFSAKTPEEICSTLSNSINLNEIKGVHALEHNVSYRIFKDYYDEIKKDINNLINKKAGDTATIKTFGSLYVKNILKNIPYLDNYKPVANLFDKMKSFPALIITSGPSLEKYFETLHEQQNNFFIICVDSALPVLQNQNIIPDFIISIDPQPYIYEHYQDVKTNGIPVFTISTSSILFSKKDGFISLNSHPISQLIENYKPAMIGNFDSKTGSVAGDSISFALKLGFNSIGLMGFDFSFTDYKIYSRGTAYNNRYSKLFQNRLLTVETLNLNYIMKSSKGYKNSGKYTRKSFINYKNAFEKFIHPNREKIYNINDRGIPVENVSNITMEKYIKSFCSEELNKKQIVQKMIHETPCLKSDEIKSALMPFLNDKDLLSEVLKASLGEEISSREINYFNELFLARGFNPSQKS